MERFLIPKDSYIDIQKDDVDGKMYITVTVEPKFEPKDGDFLVSYDGAGMLTTCIYHRTTGEGAIVTYAGGKATHITTIKNTGWGYTKDYILASEKQKQDFIDWLEKIGKRWNADEKCVEDIPKRKFKAGDKVKIKYGISSDAHRHVGPFFTEPMDKFIGKELTVKGYSSRGWVVFYGDRLEYEFAEDWLEPWSDEKEGLEEGDLAIFWDGDPEYARITEFSKKEYGLYSDDSGLDWRHAVKFECTKEQKEFFNKVRKGEI